MAAALVTTIAGYSGYKPVKDEAFWGEWARHIIDSRVGGGIPRHLSGGYIKNSLKRILAGEPRLTLCLAGNDRRFQFHQVLLRAGGGSRYRRQG